MARPMTESGYTDCDCPTCFEIAIGSEGDEVVLCGDCEEAGCDGESDCCADHFDDMEADHV